MLAAVIVILLRRRCYRCYLYSRQAFKVSSPRQTSYSSASREKSQLANGKPWRADTVASSVLTSDLESERDVVNQLLKMELQASNEATKSRKTRELPSTPSNLTGITSCILCA